MKNIKDMSRDEKIIYFYVNQLKSIRQTAKIVGCSPLTVAKILKAKDLTRSYEESLKIRSSEEYIEKIALSKLGTKNASAKLDEEKVRAIRKEYDLIQKNKSIFKSKLELAEHFGVKRQTLNDVIFNRTWVHVK